MNGDRPWLRLEFVIKNAGMSINSFATAIGMSRSQSLYQIKQGHIGISQAVAEAIVKAFPEYSLSWLLTGQGAIYDSPSRENGYIPYYKSTISQLETIYNYDPESYLYLPFLTEFDLAIQYMDNDMSPEIEHGSVLVLKRIKKSAIIPGNIYAIRTSTISTLRRVRVCEDDAKWALCASNTERYDPIMIYDKDIVEVLSIKAVISLKN